MGWTQINAVTSTKEDWISADKKVYAQAATRALSLFKGESKEKFIFLIEFTLNKTNVFKENTLSIYVQ